MSVKRIIDYIYILFYIIFFIILEVKINHQKYPYCRQTIVLGGLKKHFTEIL